MAGFINPLTQNLPGAGNKGNVVKRLIAGPTGTQIQYVDPLTNQVIANPAGYNIIEPQIADIESLGLTPTSNGSTPKPQEQPTDSGSAQNNPSYQAPYSGEGGRLGSYESKGTGNRNEANNYGYIDKPGFLGMAGALPGALGLAGKGLNAAINANNVGAVNAARDTMDVPDLTGKETLGGILNDRKGFVGSVDIQNQKGQTNQYAVGLEAMTPSGATTLTPNEARMRAFANPENIELSEDQSVGRQKGMIRSFIDSLFDDDEVETTKRGGFTVAKEKTGGSYDKFPDRPNAPSGTSKNDTGKSRGDLSDKANSDIDKGKGGLY